MSAGRFGDYGGQYVPEVLMPAVEELESAYERYVLDNEDGFMDEFRTRLSQFGGRPTPLHRADTLSEQFDAEVYLKREDLLHGGAHKLNNALGQVLLAQYMGKDRIIAETGAGQHGTAVAMACAHLDIDCEIFMGRTDIRRQRPNVFRMLTHDAAVNPVDEGSGTLKEAINATMRDWATNVEDTHYVIGSVVGPHPFPSMVRDFQAVISEEARGQSIDLMDGLPGTVLACAGGGSNTMGSFQHFREDPVDLVAVEAGGESLTIDSDAEHAPHSASISTGTDGVLHGAHTRLLQTDSGQIVESHSVSAGLDYAGVGPELAHMAAEGLIRPVSVDDDAALDAFHLLSRAEGIIPALESSHAVAALGEYEFDGPVLVTISGRGDKDLDTVIEESDRRNLDSAPNLEVFSGE
ncbi:tryptophan synthase subunit beta [Halodesulfurarchaeum sp.]|uniref:tryptophan synthase subunit beta n=1 Tax=Halodesulfurarchaeum sp. TaxID=1980530 RepID=UPI002FC32547